MCCSSKNVVDRSELLVLGCTVLSSHAAPDNMPDVASRRCGRTGEDGVAAGGSVRPGRRGCSMGFQIS